MQNNTFYIQFSRQNSDPLMVVILLFDLIKHFKQAGKYFF